MPSGCCLLITLDARSCALQRLEQEYGDQDVEAEGEAVLNGEPVSSSVTSSIVQPAAKTAAVGSVPMAGKRCEAQASVLLRFEMEISLI
jgi:hypothetical protein